MNGYLNDIDVVLADEPNFGLWMDGQPAKLYYQYQSGRATSGDIDVKLMITNVTRATTTRRRTVAIVLTFLPFFVV